MASLVRVHDWAATPLGPAEAWPASRKAVVDLLLASGFPTVALWGPDLIQIYNDGYRELMGDRHPADLGQPGRECRTEAWHIDGPIWEHVRAGETVTLEDVLHPLTRSGSLQDAWFTLSCSPLRDEAGSLAGILVTMVETTARHLAERQRSEAEGQLRRSEVRHQLLVESWTQAVWGADASGALLVGAPSWRASAGPAPAEWLGQGWLDAIHPEDRAHAERLWHEAVAARSPMSAELRLRAPGGGWRWTDIRATPVLDAEGRIERWVGMDVDIDARKRAEAALNRGEAELLHLRAEVAGARLRESEERLAAIFASAPVGLSEVGLDGRFLRANEELCRILGRSGDEVLTLGITDVTHAADVPPSLAAVAQAVGTGRPSSLDQRYLRPDGTVVWASSTVTRLHDGTGRPGNLLVVTVDLTARRAAEAAIAESEGRLRTLMQGIPQLIWRAGTSGYWTWSGPQWQAYTGQSLEQSLGLGWLEAVHPDDRQAAMGPGSGSRPPGDSTSSSGSAALPTAPICGTIPAPCP